MAGELEQVVWLVQVAKADIDESGEQGLTPVTPARGRWDFAPAPTPRPFATLPGHCGCSLPAGTCASTYPGEIDREPL